MPVVVVVMMMMMISSAASSRRCCCRHGEAAKEAMLQTGETLNQVLVECNKIDSLRGFFFPTSMAWNRRDLPTIPGLGGT